MQQSHRPRGYRNGPSLVTVSGQYIPISTIGGALTRRVPRRPSFGYRIITSYIYTPTIGGALARRVPRRTSCGYRIDALYIYIPPTGGASTSGYRNGPLAVTILGRYITISSALANHWPLWVRTRTFCGYSIGALYTITIRWSHMYITVEKRTFSGRHIITI